MSSYVLNTCTRSESVTRSVLLYSPSSGVGFLQRLGVSFDVWGFSVQFHFNGPGNSKSQVRKGTGLFGTAFRITEPSSSGPRE